MKSLNLRYLFLTLALASFGSAQANYDDDRSADCCKMDNCYECGCNPLYSCAWDIAVQAGVCPIRWTGRGHWSVLENGADVNLFRTPNFSHLYRLPWIVGGQVGYAWSDNVRLYLEFDYLQASRKNRNNAFNESASSTVLDICVGKYKAFEFYVGGRYYFDRWCDRYSFFLGGKIGLISHRKVHFTGTITYNSYILAPSLVDTETPLFRSKTQVSGGVNGGIDICFGGNWSFVITGEVVANRGPRGHSIPLTGNPLVTATSLSIGKAGTELLFPVTAGIRYSF